MSLLASLFFFVPAEVQCSNGGNWILSSLSVSGDFDESMVGV